MGGWESTHSIIVSFIHLPTFPIQDEGGQEAPLYSEEDLKSCLDKIEVIDFQQVSRWVGGWVGGRVVGRRRTSCCCARGWVEEEKAVRMSYCELGLCGWDRMGK